GEIFSRSFCSIRCCSNGYGDGGKPRITPINSDTEKGRSAHGTHERFESFCLPEFLASIRVFIGQPLPSSVDIRGFVLVNIRAMGGVRGRLLPLQLVSAPRL